MRKPRLWPGLRGERLSAPSQEGGGRSTRGPETSGLSALEMSHGASSGRLSLSPKDVIPPRWELHSEVKAVLQNRNKIGFKLQMDKYQKSNLKTKPKMNRKSDTSVTLGCILVCLLGNQQEKGREPSTNHWQSQTIKFCNRKYLIHVACDAGPCCFETPSHLNSRKNTQWPVA